MSLKLIKAGQVVQSQIVKSYFMNAAKEIQLLSDQLMADSKKLEVFKNKLVGLVPKEEEDAGEVTDDVKHFFKRLTKRYSREKKEYLAQLEETFKEFTTCKEDMSHTPATQTSMMQKALKQIFQEIWASVVTTTCPHCQGKSPSFRKDGYTKIFIRPFSEKMRNAIQQAERIGGGASRKQSKTSVVADDGFEVTTELSTRQHTNSLGNSAFADEDEEEEEEDDVEDVNIEHQKILSTIEVRDHIERLWFKEKELLDLMYGRYYPAVDGEAFKTDSLGPKMFFMNKLIVPPNRFRPESQGGFGGGGGQGDKAFLHAHSAMLSRVLNLNLALKDALII